METCLHTILLVTLCRMPLSVADAGISSIPMILLLSPAIPPHIMYYYTILAEAYYEKLLCG